MSPFLLPPRERLADWKAFRQSLASLPETEQLDRVARYFAQAPLSKRALDFEQPDTWPTAWEMIGRGDWCQDSVAIGMEMTLRLGGWDATRSDLWSIIDPAASRVGMVLIMDRAHALNYHFGIVAPRPTGIRTLHRIAWTGRHYSRIG